jgi:uncharacterized membrane protein
LELFPEERIDLSGDGKLKTGLHILVSKTLLYGVLTSAAILAIGVIAMFAEGRTGYTCSLSSVTCLLSYNPMTVPHGDYPNTLQSLYAGLVTLKPFAIIELGIFVLIATPALRVLASVFTFAAEKDKMFVAITVFVLAVLLFSFFVVPFIPIFQA